LVSSYIKQRGRSLAPENNMSRKFLRHRIFFLFLLSLVSFFWVDCAAAHEPEAFLRHTVIFYRSILGGAIFSVFLLAISVVVMFVLNRKIRESRERMLSELLERKKIEKELECQIQLQRLISRISSGFVHVHFDKMDLVINSVLGDIGKFVGADRSYVFQFSGDGSRMDNTHEWCAFGVKPQISHCKNISLDKDLPWFARKIKAGEVVYVPRVLDLPLEAKLEKGHFEKQDIQSLIVVPMVTERRVFGFLGFDSVRTKKGWADDVVVMLMVLADILANALDRKKVEGELRTSEEKYKTIVENIHEVIMLTLPDGTISYMSPATKEVLGYEPKNLVGKRISIAHPQDQVRSQDILEKALQGKSGAGVEYRIVTQAGIEQWISHSWQPIFQDGRIQMVVSAIRNITERKRVENALRESEERFRNLMEYIPEVSIQGYGTDGTVFYWNKASEKVYGYLAHEAIGRNLSDLIVPDNLKPLFAKALEAGRLVRKSGEFLPSGELLLLQKNGRLVPVYSIHTAVYTEGKEPLLFCIDVDLSERKKVEKELREREERYRLLAENITDLVWKMDLGLNFTYFSPSISHVLGYSADDAAVLTLKKIATPAAVEMITRVLQEELIQEEDPQVSKSRIRTIELEHIRKDGSLIWVEIRATFLRDPHGRIIGIQGVTRDVSERKKAEDHLRKSEEKYRELIQNANSIILRMDSNGAITFFNEFAQKFFGYGENEIVGKNIVGTIVPDQDQRGSNLSAMIIDIGQNPNKYINNENENMKRNGDRVWITWTNKLIVNEKDGSKEVLCVGTDITERKRMEEDLRKLFYAIEQSPSTIMVTDSQGNIEYVNPKFTALTGYAHQEVIGRNPRILKSGEQPPEFYKNLWDTILSGHEWRGEFHDRKKTGELFWERSSISPIKDSRGVITHFIAIKEDVTEQKRIASELQVAFEQLKEMEHIINLSKAVVFRWQAIGEWPVEFFSGNIRQFGYEPNEFYAQRIPFRRIIHPDDVSEVVRDMERFSKEKCNEFAQQYRIYAKNGDIRWIEDYAWIRYSPEGAPTHYQGVLFDVTERKLAEEKMIEAVNMKSEFISVVSHELRTPLTAIKESINIVAEGEAGEVNKDQAEFLGLAKRNVSRLANLINDVLDYQKLESGRMELHLEEGDLNALVEETRKTMDPVAKSKGLELRVDLANNLSKMKFDPYRIIQVLNNLVNNAIKFTDKGVVTIKTSQWEGSVYVTVFDTGIGIREEDLHKLFQTFSQIATGTERKTGSTGLGLAISKQIVQQHGGQIWVDSNFGQGSAFTFRLPIRV